MASSDVAIRYFHQHNEVALPWGVDNVWRVVEEMPDAGKVLIHLQHRNNHTVFRFVEPYNLRVIGSPKSHTLFGQGSAETRQRLSENSELGGPVMRSVFDLKYTGTDYAYREEVAKVFSTLFVPGTGAWYGVKGEAHTSKKAKTAANSSAHATPVTDENVVEICLAATAVVELVANEARNENAAFAQHLKARILEEVGESAWPHVQKVLLRGGGYVLENSLEYQILREYFPNQPLTEQTLRWPLTKYKVGEDKAFLTNDTVNETPLKGADVTIPACQHPLAHGKATEQDKTDYVKLVTKLKQMGARVIWNGFMTITSLLVDDGQLVVMPDVVTHNFLIREDCSPLLGKDGVRFLPGKIGCNFEIERNTSPLGGHGVSYLPPVIGSSLALDNNTMPLGEHGVRYLPKLVEEGLSLKNNAQPLGDGSARFLPDFVGVSRYTRYRVIADIAMNLEGNLKPIGAGAVSYLPEVVNINLCMSFSGPLGNEGVSFLPKYLGNGLRLTDCKAKLGEDGVLYLPRDVFGALKITGITHPIGEGSVSYLPEYVSGSVTLKGEPQQLCGEDRTRYMPEVGRELTVNDELIESSSEEDE